MKTKETKKPLKVGIFHPDLGIGGAERLVVDIGLALKQSGHDVTFFTSHHDTQHCFPETNDGTMPVVVAGDWLPRHIFGRLNVLFAVLRSLWLIFYVYFHKSLWFSHSLTHFFFLTMTVDNDDDQHNDNNRNVQP